MALKRCRRSPGRYIKRMTNGFRGTQKGMHEELRGAREVQHSGRGSAAPQLSRAVGARRRGCSSLVVGGENSGARRYGATPRPRRSAPSLRRGGIGAPRGSCPGTGRRRRSALRGGGGGSVRFSPPPLLGVSSFSSSRRRKGSPGRDAGQLLHGAPPGEAAPLGRLRGCVRRGEPGEGRGRAPSTEAGLAEEAGAGRGSSFLLLRLLLLFFSPCGAGAGTGMGSSEGPPNGGTAPGLLRPHHHNPRNAPPGSPPSPPPRARRSCQQLPSNIQSLLIFPSFRAWIRLLDKDRSKQATLTGCSTQMSQ